MKIRHNALPYIIPAILVFACLVGAVKDASNRGVVLIIALVIVLGCVVHFLTNFLTLDNGLVKGRTGFIKVKRLSSPVGKVQYCEYTNVLCFNKIKVSALTGIYEFHNMSHAKEFADSLNNNLSK